MLDNLENSGVFTGGESGGESGGDKWDMLIKGEVGEAWQKTQQ